MPHRIKKKKANKKKNPNQKIPNQTPESNLGQSALTSHVSVTLHCLGHYPEDTTHKLHSICEQGISFVKSFIPHQNLICFI